MSYSFIITKSDRKNKKYKVIIYEDGIKRKTIHFGDTRYQDYIEYYRNNPDYANERKRLYFLRHKKNSILS